MQFCDTADCKSALLCQWPCDPSYPAVEPQEHLPAVEEVDQPEGQRQADQRTCQATVAPEQDGNVAPDDGPPAAGLPVVVPSSVLDAAGRPAPSNRITVGAIGLGGQGTGNLGGFLGDPRCQVLAVNDVDRNHCENARKRVNSFYNNQDCAGYKDFRNSWPGTTLM